MKDSSFLNFNIESLIQHYISCSIGFINIPYFLLPQKDLVKRNTCNIFRFLLTPYRKQVASNHVFSCLDQNCIFSEITRNSLKALFLKQLICHQNDV